MLIFAMKPDHDGGVALIDTDAQELVLSYEAEKDSFPRHAAFNPVNFIESASMVDRVPDVFAISGWDKGGPAATTRPSCSRPTPASRRSPIRRY